MQLRLKNEADCLDPQHTELRCGPLWNLPRWPKPSTARAVSFNEGKDAVLMTRSSINRMTDNGRIRADGERTKPPLNVPSPFRR